DGTDEPETHLGGQTLKSGASINRLARSAEVVSHQFNLRLAPAELSGQRGEAQLPLCARTVLVYLCRRRLPRVDKRNSLVVLRVDFLEPVHRRFLLVELREVPPRRSTEARLALASGPDAAPRRSSPLARGVGLSPIALA